MAPTRSAVTSWLELAGLLFLAAASGVLVDRWSLAAALGTSGAVLITESAVVALLAPKPKPRGVEVG